MQDSSKIEEKYSPEYLKRTWLADQDARIDPKKLTAVFHSQVPILQYLNWRVTDTKRGFCESILPLSVESTNQHITHQAAVIMIAADYTSGVALATLLNEVPIVGIHSQKTEYGAYLWAGKADVKWVRPSCADLVCTARIEPENFKPIIKRFFHGATVLATVKIEMRNDGVLVSEANITYWVQDTYALRKNAFDENRIHPMYDHKHKTSAILIAGLRYLEQEKPEKMRLFNDDLAETVAGTHGKILAQRFRLVAPQLQPMIASRTKHLDETIKEFHRGQPIQIVNVGAGLDTRIFRMDLPQGSISFELDLPAMLKRRDQLIDKSQLSTSVRRVAVPIDLREQDAATALANCSEFNPHSATFIVWEGGSMYFEPDETLRILASLQSLLVNSDSRLWMDYVSQSIIDGTSGFQVVTDFMDAVRSLGEPFINGFTDVVSQIKDAGLGVEQDLPSNYCLQTDDSVFELYRFCLAKRSI